MEVRRNEAGKSFVDKKDDKFILQDLFETILSLSYAGIVNGLEAEQIKEHIAGEFKRQGIAIEEGKLLSFIRQLALDLKDPHDVFWLQQTGILPELERITGLIVERIVIPSGDKQAAALYLEGWWSCESFHR